VKQAFESNYKQTVKEIGKFVKNPPRNLRGKLLRLAGTGDICFTSKIASMTSQELHQILLRWQLEIALI
jgi:hypothetical protein